MQGFGRGGLFFFLITDAHGTEYGFFGGDNIAVTDSAESCSIAKQRVVAEAESPCAFFSRAIELQGRVGRQHNAVAFFHLAQLLYQFGSTLVLVKIHVDFVGGPCAEKRGFPRAGQERKHYTCKC